MASTKSARSPSSDPPSDHLTNGDHLVALVIEHVETFDDPVDGDVVVPGLVDDGHFWALVRHVDGRALWRRLSLKEGDKT